MKASPSFLPVLTAWIPMALLVCSSSVFSAPITWDNSDVTGLWSSGANWDSGSRPLILDDAILPTGLGGTITLDTALVLGVTTFPTANSIQFDDNYTVTGASFLGGNLGIGVAGGSSVSFGAPLQVSTLTKSDAGTLILSLPNTVTGVAVNGGVLRAGVLGALGGSGILTNVNSGGTLEINGFDHNRPVQLNNGSTLKGLGTASTFSTTGSLVVDAAAAAVSMGATGASDVLTTKYLSGGSTSTVMTVTGDGTLRLTSSNAFLASWVVPSGKLQLAGTLALLGQHSAGSVTMSGGTLAVELNASPANYTSGAGNNILVTANSSFLNDRSTAGFGRDATFGALSMGAQTLTISAGSNITSGDAGFVFESLTLSGNPVFDITQGNTGPGHMSVKSLSDGGSPRAITKTGPGNMTFFGGTTSFGAGSTYTSSGGGTLQLEFPPIGLDPVTQVTMAENPIGNADLSMTDGTLYLAGSGTAATYALTTNLTLDGTVTLDPNRNVSGYGNDTFRMASITLKPNTVVNMAGDNSFGVGSLGPMVLQGNATLQGTGGTVADGLLYLDGGISGGPSSALTINGSVRPLNLTIGAPGTYGGGTVMHGSNVILNAANGFGTGTTTLNGGTLTLNADAALNGTVTINGGSLIVMGQNVLASNPVLLNGGLLDLRTTATTTLPIPSLMVSGTSALSFSRFGSTSSFVITTPTINVLGTTTLTVTNGTSTTNLVPHFELAGDLTLSTASTTRVTSITEDGTPRKFIKTGTGQLELEGVSNYSGGTEVLAGTLYVKNSNALGSDTLTIGNTSGTSAVIARFVKGLTIPNDIVVRSGSSGLMTLDAEGGLLTWNGTVELQKSVTLDNGGGATDLSTFNGVISGVGDITKIAGGEILLANASNSFGSGSPTSVSISAGSLTVASDGALGNAANGVNLTISGILKIAGTFATPRTVTVTGAGADVFVTAGNTFTLNSPVAGTGTFNKGDAGTLVIAPGVDATARGSAISQLSAGVLRLQGAKNLGDASPLTVSGGTLELLNDSNTNFAYPVTLGASNATIHVDRAVGGSATNGRHTLGAFSATSGNLTTTGAYGFGLTLQSYTSTSSSSITNNAPGTLMLGSLTGNPGTSARTLTVGGTGDIEVTGATDEGVGTGSYGIIKTGPGTLTFGTSLAEFGRILTVNDGLVDLNGLSYSATGLVTIGGTASVLGAKINTGATGSLNLAAGLTFSNTGSPAEAVITGNVDVGALPQVFTVNPSAPADPDLTIDGPISGSPGSSISKTGSGTLRLAGAGNTLPGPISISNGILELGKSSGDAIGTGGLDIATTTLNATVLLTAANQIHNNASVSLNGASEVILDLNNFTETVGPLSLTQTDNNDYTAVKTGATGTLVMNGSLTFNNNINSSSNEPRNVLITGSGSETVPAYDGFLDLGGVTRTIEVSTTTVGTNEPKANATIETQIINGGILKTGTRTLYLTNPNNTFAGGLQIAQGFVKPAGGTSLGLGPVTFTNGPGITAGIDLGTLTGTLSNVITTGSGTGDVTFIYSAPAPDSLILGGGIPMTQNLIFDVVNGTTNPGDSAVLNETGVLDDGAGTFGLTKLGNGTLKLAAGNTFGGGTTVQKGILSITADSALGDSTAVLTIDGGCLQTAASFILPRDLVFGPIGGSVRVDSPALLELAGDVAWDTGTTAFFGSGMTVLSGTTTGIGGNLQLGSPTSFAAAPSFSNLPLGHVLSLRGTAALPAGNLSITNGNVLELGNGDFTRALGTGDGEVQLPTNYGGGWAAYGADRTVNLGGVGDTLVWGQISPAFLYSSGYGPLILGSSTATHTVDFQNPIQLNNGAISMTRKISVPDGPAALDARVSGGIDQSANPATTFTHLQLDVAGTLEINSPLSGEIDIDKMSAGTAILSGTNSRTGDVNVEAGTLLVANDASWNMPSNLYVDAGAELDVSALTSPIEMTPGYSYMSVDGTVTGDVITASTFTGNGLIDGDLSAQDGSQVYPSTDGLLHVTGDYTHEAGAYLDFYIDGLVPQVDFSQMRVGGAVNLSGDIYLGASWTLLEGGTVVLILNDGTDPINGTFNGLPEGAAIPIGNGLALQVTYIGGDGNDFAATVVADTFSSDLNLYADASIVVDLGGDILVSYQIYSPGPGTVSDAVLDVTLPLNATLSTPLEPGWSINSGILSIPLPPLDVPDFIAIDLHFTAPLFSAAVVVDAYVYSIADTFESDNYYTTTTAVLPGGCPMITDFTRNETTGNLEFGIDTIDGVIYVLESSTDLGETGWQIDDYIYGDGLPYMTEQPTDDPSGQDFFRFRIIPNNGGGGGGGGEF